ncbi:hypothetical protein, partial [Thiolapillus sp.]|uniref:hypothetical protein n=1 Tax=Thiolapillus sp. TaxID=2017437 RepID=UPI003AF78D0A
MQQHLNHADDSPVDQRHAPDRRTQQLKAVFCSLYKARRRSVRRKEAATSPITRITMKAGWVPRCWP